MSLLVCRDLVMSYAGKVALSGVSFEVAEGDYFCIVGENGSGKSTLLKGLLGLKRPDAGEIVYADGVRRSGIGYLPQQTDVQKDFPASVMEVVLSGCLNNGGWRPFYTRRDKERAMQNLRRLEIDDMKNACYRELSGGQQQRVLLARALCAAGSLLLLDEPLVGLDPLVSAGLYRLLLKLNREEGLTVIMISHDVQSVVRQADKILHMHTRPLFYGTAAEYRQSELGRRFLGGAADA